MKPTIQVGNHIINLAMVTHIELVEQSGNVVVHFVAPGASGANQHASILLTGGEATSVWDRLSTEAARIVAGNTTGLMNTETLEGGERYKVEE